MIPCVMPAFVRFTDTEGIMEVARGWWRGNGGLSVQWAQFRPGEDDQVLEMMAVMAA